MVLLFLPGMVGAVLCGSCCASLGQAGHGTGKLPAQLLPRPEHHGLALLYIMVICWKEGVAHVPSEPRLKQGRAARQRIDLQPCSHLPSPNPILRLSQRALFT